ncbi:MAG: YicC family protein [Peptococcaceae bacterium]|nr:YicC family protein [Peptococcaceae bacterium]
MILDKDSLKAPVSMTGFGVGRAVGGEYSLAVEMKSTNHRFLEIIVHMPREWGALEEGVKKHVRRVARRGRVEVSVIARPESQRRKTVVLDKELALEYDSKLKELAAFLSNGYRSEIGYLASCPDVLYLESQAVNADLVWPVLEEALCQALDQFACMRETEGRVLTQDLSDKVAELETCISIVAGRADGVVDSCRERLESKLKQALGMDSLRNDPRLAQELVLVAERMSIEEEILRLRSHIGQFTQALNSEEAVGRRLDFLVQEMNREINTIGAKAGDLVISQQVIRAKGLVENLKEQAMNLE